MYDPAPCLARNYSPASARMVLDAVSTTQDLCKEIVKIFALVEAGTLLISSCYQCESNEPIIFVVSNIMRKLMNVHGDGVDNCHLVDLVQKANIAVDLVTKNEMVLNMFLCVWFNVLSEFIIWLLLLLLICVMKGPILDAMKSAKVALDIAKVSVTDAKEALGLGAYWWD